MLCLKPNVYSIIATPTYCVRMSVCWSSSVKCSLRTSTLLNLRATCTWPTRPPERWSRPQFSALMIASYVENCVTGFKWENVMSLRDVIWILFASQTHRAVFLLLIDSHIRITVSSFHTENHSLFNELSSLLTAWTTIITNISTKKPELSPMKFNIFKAILNGHAVAQSVEALRYKPEDRGFDSRWCHWNF